VLVKYSVDFKLTNDLTELKQKLAGHWSV